MSAPVSTGNPCADLLLQALMASGTWTTRQVMDLTARRAGYGEARIDDEIVYLVGARAVEFNPRALSYRLVAESGLARQAAARLAATPADGPRLQVLGRPAAQGGGYDLGAALRTTDSKGEPMTVTFRISVPAVTGEHGQPDGAAGAAEMAESIYRWGLTLCGDDVSTSAGTTASAP
jgi:hypothetical protein